MTVRDTYLVLCLFIAAAWFVPSPAHAQAGGYVPCSESPYAGSPPPGTDTLVATEQLVIAGATVGTAWFCTWPEVDADGNDVDDNWIQVQNYSAAGLQCSATLDLFDENDNPFQGGQGSNNVAAVDQVVDIVNSGFTINTGIDVSDSTIQCTLLSGGGGGGGGGGSASSSGTVSFVGSVDVGAINYSSDTVDITVNEIFNSAGTTSPSLDIELWFTSTPYPGSGGISGYKVAHFALPSTGNCSIGISQLPANSGCENINSGLIAVTAPPGGTYFATLVIGESGSGCNGYCIVDGVPLANQETVPAPAAAANTFGPSASSSSSGKGGGMDVPTILVLLTLAVLRIAKVSRQARSRLF